MKGLIKELKLGYIKMRDRTVFGDINISMEALRLSLLTMAKSFPKSIKMEMKFLLLKAKLV